jgi:hypothetical protein
MTRIRTTHPRWLLVVSAVLLAAAAGTRAQAQGEEQKEPLDRTPASCVLLNRVAKSTGVTDRQVVIAMRGGTYYRNDLDGSCPQLAPGDTQLVYHYRTGSAKITRLCDTDSFTIDNKPSTGGCALGKFHPITAEEAAALTGKPVAAPTASAPAAAPPAAAPPATSGNDQK